MASLKAIRLRIKSIKSTQKITKAMHMVSASKLRRAKDAMDHNMTYANLIADTLNQLPRDSEYPTKLEKLVLRSPDAKPSRALIVVMTSERGLCGVVVGFVEGITLSNANAYISLSNASGSSGGSLNFLGNLTGTTGNTVLALTTDATVAFGGSSGTMTVTGNIINNSGSTAGTINVLDGNGTTQNVIFAGDIGSNSPGAYFNPINIYTGNTTQSVTTFQGNVYAAAGSTAISLAVSNAMLSFGGGTYAMTVTGDILNSSGASSSGIISVLDGQNVTFAGNIGGSGGTAALNQINVYTGAAGSNSTNFQGNVTAISPNATAISLMAVSATASFGGGASGASSSSPIVITGNIINNVNNSSSNPAGIVNIADGYYVNFAGDVGEQGGYLSQLNVGDSNGASPTAAIFQGNLAVSTSTIGKNGVMVFNPSNSNGTTNVYSTIIDGGSGTSTVLIIGTNSLQFNNAVGSIGAPVHNLYIDIYTDPNANNSASTTFASSVNANAIWAGIVPSGGTQPAGQVAGIFQGDVAANDGMVLYNSQITFDSSGNSNGISVNSQIVNIDGSGIYSLPTGTASNIIALGGSSGYNVTFYNPIGSPSYTDPNTSITYTNTQPIGALQFGNNNNDSFDAGTFAIRAGVNATNLTFATTGSIYLQDANLFLDDAGHNTYAPILLIQSSAAFGVLSTNPGNIPYITALETNYPNDLSNISNAVNLASAGQYSPDLGTYMQAIGNDLIALNYQSLGQGIYALGTEINNTVASPAIFVQTSNAPESVLQITATSPLINLGNTTLTASNSASVPNAGSGASNLNFNGDISLNTAFNSNNSNSPIGSIVINGAGSTFNLANANSLNITIDAGSVAIPSASYTILSATNGATITAPGSGLSNITTINVVNAPSDYSTQFVLSMLDASTYNLVPRVTPTPPTPPTPVNPQTPAQQAAAVAQSIAAATSGSSSAPLSDVLAAFVDSSGNVTGSAVAALAVLVSVPAEQQVTLLRQIQVNPIKQNEFNNTVTDTIGTTLNSTPSYSNILYEASIEDAVQSSGGGSDKAQPIDINQIDSTAGSPTTSSSNQSASSLMRPEEDIRAEGISAGDLVKPHGIWTSGSAFTSYARQGVITDYAGYKSHSSGGALGIDLKLSDHWMGGLAATYSKSIVNMCNYAIGSSYKTDSTMLTLYGMYLPTPRLFVRSSMTYGMMINKDNSPRVVNYNYQEPFWIPVVADAYSKYKSDIISPDLTIGYRFGSKVTFSPSIGINYLRTISQTYSESGADPWNMHIRQRPKAGIWTGTLGMGLSTAFMVQQHFFMPEVHASFRRTLHGQNPLTLTSFEGSSATYVSKTKPTKKVTYGLGGSLTVIASKAVSVGFGYDASLGQKYVGHRGSLRLRVSF